MCDWKNPLSCPGDIVKDAAGGVAKNAGQSAMEGVADFFTEAAEWAVKNLTTAWLNAPAPDVEGANSPSMWLQDRLSYFVAVAMIAAFFVAAYRLATMPRVQHVRDLGDSIVRVVLVTTVGGLLITTGVEIGEIFSDWILEQADVNLGGLAIAGLANPGLMLILALVMLLAQLIQLVLMIVRNAMIVYLAAVLPLAAASSTTAAGKQWWSKSVAWLVAFILYKPVAALIYAGAFKMLSAENNITTRITGVVAVVMAVLALPAIMRFVVPATASMAAGNAGAMALGFAGAAVATGAAVASGGASAASGAGFSGSSAGVGAATGGSGGGAAALASNGPSGAPDTGGSTRPASGPSSAPQPGTDESSDDAKVPAGVGAAAVGSDQAAPTGPTASGATGGTSVDQVVSAARMGQSIGQTTSDTASGAVEEER